jgi:hypothetical protein
MENYQRKTEVHQETHLRDITADPGSTESYPMKITGHNIQKKPT